MSKIKTIKLEATQTMDNKNATGWRTVWGVLQVTDSTEYTPGLLLEKASVDELCAAKNWKVTVVGKAKP